MDKFANKYLVKLLTEKKIQRIMLIMLIIFCIVFTFKMVFLAAISIIIVLLMIDYIIKISKNKKGKHK